jgi:hypothetical protein
VVGTFIEHLHAYVSSEGSGLERPRKPE